MSQVTNKSLRFASSPKKRINTDGSLVVEGDLDDNLERRQRRNNAEVKKRLSFVPSPNGHTSPKRTQDLKDHIMSVIKLNTENKICPKNAWNLKIIDYVRGLFKSHEFNRDTLQVATSSLDASAKVYSLRVDDIYTEGLSLASSMARCAENNDEEEENNNESQLGSDQEKQNKLRRKRRRKYINGQKGTIARNDNVICGDFQKLESSLFKSKTARGEVCLFSLSLPMDHSGLKQLLRCQEPYSYSDPSVELNQKIPCAINQDIITICPEFSEFKLDEWEPEDENDLVNGSSKKDNEVIYDDTGLPIPQLDGSIMENIEDAAQQMANYDQSSDEEDILSDNVVIKNDEVINVADYTPDMNVGAIDSDYSFHQSLLCTNKYMSRIWAGPSHWKLKFIKRSNSKFSGNNTKLAPKTPRKTKAPPQPINLNILLPLDAAKPPEKKKLCLPGDISKFILPMNFNMESTDRKQFLLRKFHIHPEKQGGAKLNVDVDKYNYENPNDSQYCPVQADFDSNDVGENYCDDEYHDEVVEKLEFYEQHNLVDMPELVQKNVIAYAQQAKKMDMKKLKTVLWKSITTDTSESFESVDEKSVNKLPALPHTFSDVMQALPSRVTDKMRVELSCPLAFIAILHLANEHNLKLSGQDDFADFKIEQG